MYRASAAGPTEEENVTMDSSHMFVYGGRYQLTTASPASHYGLPVLRHLDCNCPDLHPADLLCDHADRHREIFGDLSAGELVSRCAILQHFPREDYLMAQRFLQQWPTGPQLTPWCEDEA